MATNPSPRAHLFRLAGLLILGGTAFVVVRAAMIPDTWNAENSFREGFLDELATKPPVHGGSASCVECHEAGSENHQTAMEALLDGPHNGINCETCHGALGDHVANGKKFGDAVTEYSRLACLGCHANLISSPPQLPKFITAHEEMSPRREAEMLEARLKAGKKKIYRHKENVHSHMDCTECHYSFHNPSED